MEVTPPITLSGFDLELIAQLREVAYLPEASGEFHL